MESQRSRSNNNSNRVVQNIVLTLDNCLFPKDKIENPPSLMDGMDESTETELRIKACELIQTAGILLKLPQVAMATGQVLFQRFYYCKSFVRHPADVTAMGCVCLASKIEEAPRRIRDVINVFHHIRQVQGQKPIEPLILDQHYIALKTQVIKAERRILKELGFCVHVKHPHKLIVMYLQVLGLEKKYPGLLQMSWNYMNDSLRTNVFVEYSPETVACACIFLSARKLRIIMPKNPDFYVIFGTKEEDMLNICRKILKLYKRPRITLEELEDRVKELRTKLDEERERNKLVAVSTAENTPTGADRNKSPVSPTTFNSSSKSQTKKRSRSRSKSKLKSRSPVTSKSRSDSSSPSRHRKLKRNKEYNHRASHKTVKASSYKRTSGSPSPSKSRHHKKYKSKRRNGLKDALYQTGEASKSSSDYSYWKNFYSHGVGFRC